MPKIEDIDKAVEMKNVILHALRQAKYLEKRLEQTFDYVDPILENYKKNSSLVAKEIILQACIQIEAVAKTYYKLFYKKCNRFNFKMWCKAFPQNSDEDIRLQSIRINFEPIRTILLPKPYGVTIFPWKHEPDKNPTWWSQGYNIIKHGDSTNMNVCTYENALLSITGLYAMIVLTKDFGGVKQLQSNEFTPKYFGGTSLLGIFKY